MNVQISERPVTVVDLKRPRRHVVSTEWTLQVDDGGRPQHHGRQLVEEPSRPAYEDKDLKVAQVQEKKKPRGW